MPLIALADYLPDEVEMYVEGLRRFGFEVLPVETEQATEAAKTIGNVPCDAVVTRILPCKFGIELLRALRGDDRTKDLPVIVITSFPSPALHDEARAAGATDVLLLPQTPEHIARAVQRLIHRSPAA
jgi:two-component system phosphate regulon response regulator PhoB